MECTAPELPNYESWWRQAATSVAESTLAAESEFVHGDNLHKLGYS